MKSQEILEKYINFYKERGHAVIPNVSLIPENDPTLLYVNSGMFPLVPYLEGEPHPLGTKLVNIQRCLRFFEDLENIGETNRHTTAFHMIGNWGLGSYFKKEQLPWMYEFYIEELGLDPQKVYATVFAGDEEKGVPKDTESVELLKEIFKKYGIEAKEGERIFETKKANWWQRGDAVGELGGPSSEIFYYIGADGDGFGQNILEDEEEFVEIGNSVFMQYKKTEAGWEPLKQKNIDFGGGFERIALCVQQKQDIYETDNFWPIIQEIEKISSKKYNENKDVTKAMRKLADHMRSSTFLAMDGVTPSNKDQGYILRRLLRLMVRAGKTLGVEKDISVKLVPIVADMFEWMYPDLQAKKESIQTLFAEEENKFRKTLLRGSREAEKTLTEFSGNAEELASHAFNLYQSLGYPLEMFLEDVKERNLPNVDLVEIETIFNQNIKDHQQQSREGAEQKFKGGLADQSEQVIKYHTATHLLHWALRQVLGEQVTQQGSNITGERLRFDFSHTEKLSEEEIATVEKLVNEKVVEALPVNFEIMPKEKAEQTGALHFFGEKYGDQVKVYYIGESLESAVSKEFCGGPHVGNTCEIGNLKIYKQDKIGKGSVRIYAK